MAVEHPNTARHRGGTLVETAIVITLLMTLTLGLIEYGWMFLKSQQITNAARQGARVGARVDSGDAEVQQAVADAMAVAGLAGSGYGVTIQPAGVAGLEPGTLFTVTVDVVYDQIDLGMPLVPVPASLSSAVSMAKEGP